MNGRDWKELAKKATRQGWRVERTNGDHYRWLSPDHQTVVITGGTVSDRRGLLNTISRLRKGGFNDRT